MKWNRSETTIENIKETLTNLEYTFTSTHDIRVDVEFDLESYDIYEEEDALNFTGVVHYSVDTEYGGGPSELEIEFRVYEGILEMDLDEVDWDSVLDFSEIDMETDTEYGDGVLDSDDDWDD